MADLNYTKGVLVTDNGDIRYQEFNESFFPKYINYNSPEKPYLTYPNSNNIFFIIGHQCFDLNMIGFQGIKIDDDLLSIFNDNNEESKKLCDLFASETGRYYQSINMTDIVDNYFIQSFYEQHKINKNRIESFFQTQINFDTKQNAYVFIKNKQLQKISHYAYDIAGYKKENLHLLLEFNNFFVTKDQTSFVNFPYVVTFNIDDDTNLSIDKLLDITNDYMKSIDGDIWISTNKVKIGNRIEFYSPHPKRNYHDGTTVSIMIIAFRIKASGQTHVRREDLKEAIIYKINSYVHLFL